MPVVSLIPASRKARIAIGLATLPVILGIVFFSTYFVVQSSSFKEYLSRNLSTILGEHIDIGQDIQISRIFPRLTIVLPNVKIRPTSLGSNVERVRVDGFTLTVSPKVLLSGGEKGSIDIHVNEATLLSAASSSAPAASDSRASLDATQTTHERSQNVGTSTPALDGNSDAETSIARALDDFLQGSTSLHIALTTDRIVYIVRDTDSGSTRYDITQLTLSSKDRSIKLAALVDAEEQSRRSISAIFDTTDTDGSHDGNAVQGEISVEISSAATDSKVSQDSPLSTDTHVFSTPVEIDGNRIDLTALEYNSPVGWIRGTLNIDLSGEQTIIQTDLEVRKLQLSLTGNQAIRSTTDSNSDNATRLFPFKPFSFRIPEHIVAQANVQLGAIRLDSTPIINGDLHLSVSGGEAKLTTKNLTLLGGPSDLSLTVTNPEYGFASVLMKLEADDIQLNRIRTPDTGEPVLSKGKADLIMALRGSGPSPGHIAASSNGYMIATVDSAEINQKYTTAIDRGVVSWGLDRISVLTSNSDSERVLSRLSDPLFVPCASVKLYLNDGRAEVSNGFIIELPQNTLYSSGFINLYDEQLGFAFRARNKSLFDWSAISIARFAEISGTLADPSVSLNKNELAKQGILSTSSIVWGPLPSLVYTLAESGLKNSKSKQCRKSIE